jgi:hypothetical protein
VVGLLTDWDRLRRLLVSVESAATGDDAIGKFADVATGLHANTGTEGPPTICGDTAAAWRITYRLPEKLVR